MRGGIFQFHPIFRNFGYNVLYSFFVPEIEAQE